MSESIWEELARSPLDPDPDEQPSPLQSLLRLGVAAIAGLLVGFFLLGSGGETTATTAVAAPTTTAETNVPQPADPEVPPGYVDVDGVGLDAMVAYSRAGNLYIVVNEASRSDQSPAETASFHGAEWVLDGDGVSITATRTIVSSLAPGVSVIEFANVTTLPNSAPVLSVRQASEMVVRTGCQGCGATSVDEATGEVVLEGIDRPFVLKEPLLIDVGAGITLAVDRLDFTDDWGYVEWHIVDENQGRMRTMVRIVFEGTDDPGVEGTQPTQLIPISVFGPSQQNPTAANPAPFARTGSLLLDRVGELLSAENTPRALVLQWTAEWQHPVGEPIPISLAGITDIGIID